MIYISTSCVKADTIKEAVSILLRNGFKNIELSGGTEYYTELEYDLMKIKEETNVNFLLHNYFPPPQNQLVLNLSSLDDEIYNNSLEHYKKALDLSDLLGAKKFGLHAGLLIDPKVKELGKSISTQAMYDRSKAIDRFCEGYEILNDYSKGTKLYVENNVFSDANNKRFASNPFLFTDYNSYIELSQLLKFNVLLDVAHLKVSCNSLDLSFGDELIKLAEIAEYIHISDNDALSDSNEYLRKDSDMFKKVSKLKLKDKTITIEIYEDLQKIINSFELLTENL